MSLNKNIDFTVRQIKTSDFEEVLQILKNLNNFLVSKYDYEIMIKVDAHGIFVAQDLNSGLLLGVCIGINLSPEQAFIGHYFIRQEYQKMGIGKEIWSSVMQHIGPDRSIGLFCSSDISNLYQDKFGFTIIPGIINNCYTGIVDCNKLIEAIDGISVVPINENNIQKVIQYDKQLANGLDRTALIEETVKISEYVKRMAINEKGQVVGYCFLKVTIFDKGIVEPLYANEEKIAELLLRKCCESLVITQTNGVLYLCPNTNLKSCAIVKKLGLTIAKEAPLLYTKKELDGDLDRVFSKEGVIKFRCPRRV